MITPIFDRLLVQPVEEATVTDGGVLVPIEVIKRPNMGTVISVGDGKHGPIPVNVGDLVLFNRYAGIEMFYKGKKHFMITAHELVAKIDDINEVSFDNIQTL